MSQFNSTRSRTQSPTGRFRSGNFPAAHITRPMLLDACHAVESELRRLLRRQRRLNLEKLLRRAIGW